MPASHDKQPDQGRIAASLADERQMRASEMASLHEHERARLHRGMPC